MQIVMNLSDLVGNTPLVRLSRFEQAAHAQAALYGKLESKNPGGSIKDRVGFYMLESALSSGQIHPGTTIIEPTSGNTGIGLALAARQYRLPLKIVMPDSMSVERQMLLKAYGAEVILTPGANGLSGSVETARLLAAAITDSYIPMQFENPANPEIHRKTTGPEILAALTAPPDVLVAGSGTGGTITGVGETLKAVNPNLHIVAVEPFESQVLAGKPAGRHGIQGIGPNFIPPILNLSLINELFPVRSEDAVGTMVALAKTEGLLCGISSGAALFAAKEIARRPEMNGKNIVLILPDSGERYLSGGYF